MRKIYLFDTTLRDGAQTPGVNFSVENKQTIAAALDELGVDYIEGGFPGATPTDEAFFESFKPQHEAVLVAFGMTRRSGRSKENDAGLAQLIRSGAGAACLVGKSSDFHLAHALQISQGENLELISDSIAYTKEHLGEALFDAEHFFDGYKSNPDYAMQCLEAAHDSGARWLVLCDTNGGTLPDEVYQIVTEVAKRFGGERLGIHAHQDTGCAVANSHAALEAGACQIQGTLNGLGERCGNANLLTLIANLHFKTDYRLSVRPAGLKSLTKISRMLDGILACDPAHNAPYVGSWAFAHKGGLHASAVTKLPATYEHVEPESIGNQRRILISEQAGRASLKSRLDAHQISIARQADFDRLLAEVKERERYHYSYEEAEASFILLVYRTLDRLPRFFDVLRFRVIDETHFEENGAKRNESDAKVMLRVDQKDHMSSESGLGPVHALDRALRRALTDKLPAVENVKLVDFRVRIVQPNNRRLGTRAVTRVIVEFQDENNQSWTTIGVSENIIDASFEALRDGYIYKLALTHLPKNL